MGAIVLYSLYSAWCNYTATGSYNYKNVFIAPGQVPARTLEGLLRAASTLQVAEIYSGSTNRNGTAVGSDISSPSNGPNSNSNPSGGPSTTIAMIILYSVTAIITLCFVLVIVSGAIRARRHPERYGLLNLPIHAHQRRARGIARAMLETIPIVKFGEKEEMKLDSDLEQGTELGTAKQTDPPTQDVENVENVTLAKSKESVSKQEELPAVDPTSTETQIDGKVGVDTSDNSLACSVCTEDFVIGQDLRVLPCNHKFHPECIDPWLLNVSGTCPLW